MSLEIERKFTVNVQKLDMNGRQCSHVIEQGYLHDKPWIRVRIVNEEKAYLTIKFSTQEAITRKEYEYRIPIDEARELMKECQGVLRKMRHEIRYDAKFHPEKIGSCLASYKKCTWEVDQFLGPLAGIWLAEIEFKEEKDVREFDKLILPDWIEKEVTGDKRYSQTSFIAYGNPDKYPEGEHPIQVENLAKREVKM